MKKEITLRLFLITVITAIIFISFFTYKEYVNSNEERKPVTLEIKKGMSFYEFASILEKKGVVKSSLLLRKYAQADGLDRSLVPGRYEFKTNSSYKEVLDILKKGPEIELIKITIPEGYSNRQIAHEVSRRLGLSYEAVLSYINGSRGRFVDEFPFLAEAPTESLEGFLFPDTYYFKRNEKIEVVVRKMLENFRAKASESGLFDQDLPLKSTYKTLIIASIIEKEAKIPEERPLIASVFYNRIKRGMKLQSCATVEYVLGFSKPSLTYEDLKIDSPYNTYLYAGLPPTPICNPGKDSIKAAVKPAKTNYLYFVLKDSKGNHHFAETYDEFLKAKSRAK
jgi:UPF0755 protein